MTDLDFNFNQLQIDDNDTPNKMICDTITEICEELIPMNYCCTLDENNLNLRLHVDNIPDNNGVVPSINVALAKCAQFLPAIHTLSIDTHYHQWNICTPEYLKGIMTIVQDTRDTGHVEIDFRLMKDLLSMLCSSAANVVNSDPDTWFVFKERQLIPLFYTPVTLKNLYKKVSFPGESLNDLKVFCTHAKKCQDEYNEMVETNHTEANLIEFCISREILYRWMPYIYGGGNPNVGTFLGSYVSVNEVARDIAEYLTQKKIREKTDLKS